jgi:hypothetical protein
MQSQINSNGPHLDARWLLDQDQRTSETQIEDQTKLSKDETDLARVDLLRKCVRNSMLSTLLCRRARPRMRDAGGALSENQKPLPETRIRNSTSCSMAH